MLANIIKIIMVGIISATLYYLFTASRLKKEVNVPSFLLPFGKKSDVNRGEKVSRTFDLLIIEECLLVLIVFALGGRSFWHASLMAMVGSFSVLAVDIKLSFSKILALINQNGSGVKITYKYIEKRLGIEVLLATGAGFLAGFICYILQFVAL